MPFRSGAQASGSQRLSLAPRDREPLPVDLQLGSARGECGAFLGQQLLGRAEEDPPTGAWDGSEECGPCLAVVHLSS